MIFAFHSKNRFFLILNEVSSQETAISNLILS